MFRLSRVMALVAAMTIASGTLLGCSGATDEWTLDIYPSTAVGEGWGRPVEEGFLPSVDPAVRIVFDQIEGITLVPGRTTIEIDLTDNAAAALHSLVSPNPLSGDALGDYAFRLAYRDQVMWGWLESFAPRAVVPDTPILEAAGNPNLPEMGTLDVFYLRYVFPTSPGADLVVSLLKTGGELPPVLSDTEISQSIASAGGLIEAIDAYHEETGFYPEAADQVVPRFIGELPQDAVGRPYTYVLQFVDEVFWGSPYIVSFRTRPLAICTYHAGEQQSQWVCDDTAG